MLKKVTDQKLDNFLSKIQNYLNKNICLTNIYKQIWNLVIKKPKIIGISFILTYISKYCQYQYLFQYLPKV